MWLSDKFSSKENILRIELEGICSASGAWVLYGYTEGGEKKELRRESIAQGNFAIKHDFDPVSYGVYEGAVEFSVELEGECEITKFEVSIPATSHSEGGEIDTDFDGNLVKIYDIDGKEKWIPCAPKNILYIGNSLIAGMFISYGMCATSPQTDYAYLVSQEILKHSPNASFRKLHGSDFEHSESKEAFEKWFFTDLNPLTLRPVCEEFTKDLDLVIIQLADNVNTPEKAAAFPENADRLIREIKTRSPNARVIWVYGWYGSAETLSMVHNACRRNQVEAVNVAKYHTRENEAYLGQTCLHPSGNLVTVKDYWISHPGDKGMAAIATKIIGQLFPEKL